MSFILCVAAQALSDFKTSAILVCVISNCKGDLRGCDLHVLFPLFLTDQSNTCIAGCLTTTTIIIIIVTTITTTAIIIIVIIIIIINNNTNLIALVSSFLFFVCFVVLYIMV